MSKREINIFHEKPGNLTNTKIYKFDIRDITPNQLINILKKDPMKRNQKEKAFVLFYVQKMTQLPRKFIHEHIDKQTYESILLLSETSFTFNRIVGKNNLIYEVNDKAENIFIIIEGSAKLYKVEKVFTDMTCEEYVNLLMKYIKDKDNFLLEKTVKDNDAIFPFDKKDVLYIDKIFIKIKIIQRQENKISDTLEDILEKVNLTLADFNLLSYKQEIEIQNAKIAKENQEILKSKKMEKLKDPKEYDGFEARKKNKENQNKILDIIGKNVNAEMCLKYSFLTSESIHSICYYKYVLDKEIYNGDYFGDFNSDKYLHRAIIDSDFIDLFIIRNDIYKEFMHNKKYKLLDDQILFLQNHFFFSSINRSIFEKNYFCLFEFECYDNYENIIIENTPVNYLYFIQKGKVRLTTRRSIIENHILIGIINNIIKRIQNKNNNNSNFIIDNKYTELYSNIYNDYLDELKQEFNIKRKNNLLIFQENKCLGHECFFYGLNYLYTVTADSEKVELYKLGIDKLMKIFKDKNSDVYNDFLKQSKQSLLDIYKVSVNINTNLIYFYNQKHLDKEEKVKNDREETNKNLIDNKDDKKNVEVVNEDDILLQSKLNKYYVKKDRLSRRRIVKLNKIINNKDSELLTKIAERKNIDDRSEENNELLIKPKEEMDFFKHINLDSFSLAKNRRLKFNKIKNNFDLNKIYLYRNSSEKLIKNNLENIMINKIKHENETNINYFKLSKQSSKSVIDQNQSSQSDNKEKSTNIFTFDYPFALSRKHSAEVKFRKRKISTGTNCNIKTPSATKNKTDSEFNLYFKNYFDDVYTHQSYVINNHYAYNYNKSIMTNKKMFRYSMIELFKPKLLRKKQKQTIFNIRNGLNIKHVKK